MVKSISRIFSRFHDQHYRSSLSYNRSARTHRNKRVGTLFDPGFESCTAFGSPRSLRVFPQAKFASLQLMTTRYLCPLTVFIISMRNVSAVKSC